MNTLLLAVLLAAPGVRAQEFAADMPAFAVALEGARAWRVKHDGRPRPPLVSYYSAADLSFALIRDGAGREDGIIYANRSLLIKHLGSTIAKLFVDDRPNGGANAERVLRAFERRRQEALESGRRVIVDHDAVARQNKARAWTFGRNHRECELFDELFRLAP